MWVIEPYVDEQGNMIASVSDLLAQRLERLAVVIEDIGGVIAVSADREEVRDGIFVTVRAVVRWESFAPARRLPREAPKPVPVPVAEVEDPEPELAEEPEPATA